MLGMYVLKVRFHLLLPLGRLLVDADRACVRGAGLRQAVVQVEEVLKLRRQFVHELVFDGLGIRHFVSFARLLLNRRRKG